MGEKAFCTYEEQMQGASKNEPDPYLVYGEDFQKHCFAFSKTCMFKRLYRLNVGMDAAGYIGSDISAVPKLASKSVQGSTLLAM